MGFVLGSSDFRQIRQDREERALEAARINLRNYREDAHRLRRHGADDPYDPYGRGGGAPTPVNQVGLSAAQKEAQRVYNERVAAAKAAAAAEARQAGLKEQRPPLPPPAARAAELGSLRETHGVQLPGYDPASDKSLLGKRGAVGAPYDSKTGEFRAGFWPIKPEEQSIMGRLGRHAWNEAEFTNQLGQIRYGLSLFGSDKTPATGWLRRFTGLFTDTPADQRKVKAAGVITDWYDSDEAKQFFRQNPELFVRATQSPEEAIKIYQELKATDAGPDFPAAKVVPTKLPGGGVSLPYDPTTGTVGVIPEEAAAHRSEAFAAEVSPDLLAAVIKVESNWDPDALSPKDAKGLMQVLDSTNAKPGYGVMPAQNDSPEERVRVGRDYLGAMLLQHEGDLDRALAAYNWGPGNVNKWINKGADISKLPKETKNFIQRIKAAQLTVTPQQLGQAQALGAAGATIPGAAPAAAPAAAPGVAPAAAPAAAPVKVTTVAGRRDRTLIEDLPIAAPGEPKSVAKDIATAPDLSKIKEPDIKMPFGLFEENMTKLLALRRDLKLQVISNRGRPGSPESLKANSALSANGALVLNMTQTQALNRIQISNDPRMYNAIINRQNPGANIRISFNSDGTLRVEMGGKVIAERKDKGKFISEQRRRSSAELHKALNSAQAGATLKANEAALESIFKIRELITTGQYKLAAERIKKSGLSNGIEFQFDQRPDGTVWMLVPDEDLNGDLVHTWKQVPRGSVSAADFKRKK